MHGWPLVERELQAQSRSTRHAWARMMGVSMFLAAAVGVLHAAGASRTVVSRGFREWLVGGEGWSAVPTGMATGFEAFQGRGGDLLAALNSWVLVLIWVLAPWQAADCLSRERRQGTLGWLLLTPMSALDVVKAKWIAHGWQSLWVFLGGLPVLLLPLLLGGTTWMDAASVALVDLGALGVATGVGMVASTLWDGPRAVLIGAWVSAAVAAAVWWTVHAMAGSACASVGVTQVSGFGTLFVDALASVPWAVRELIRDPGWLLFRFGEGGMWRGQGMSSQAVLLAASSMFAVSLLGLRLMLGWVAWRTKRSVGESGTRRSAGGIEGVGNGGRQLDRWRYRGLRRLRGRTPFLWMELRTWRGQVVPWLCVATVFPWECWRTGQFGQWDYSSYALGWPAALLAAIVALASASCFHAERDGGNFEYLLTVPRGGWLMLAGKFSGLGLQALPTMLLVVGIEASMAMGVWWTGSRLEVAAVMTVALVGRMVAAIGIGAYVGWKMRELSGAFGVSLAVHAGVVAATAMVTDRILPGLDPYGRGPVLLSGALEGLAGAVFCGVLAREMLLRDRKRGSRRRTEADSPAALGEAVRT